MIQQKQNKDISKLKFQDYHLRDSSKNLNHYDNFRKSKINNALRKPILLRFSVIKQKRIKDIIKILFQYYHVGDSSKILNYMMTWRNAM